jgi:hypothetical protein
VRWAPILLVALVAPALDHAAASPECGVDRGIVNVSRTPDLAEGEESISVNPRNPKQILIGSNQFAPALPGAPVSAGGLMETASWVSQDGGCSWRHLGLETLGGAGDVANPGPVGPAEYRNVGSVVSSDQHSAWSSDGVLYYEAGFLGGVGVDGDQRAMVWRSRDGGRTFGAPVVAYSANANKAPEGSSYPDTVPELDRPWLAVDRSGGPRNGTVYMTLATGPFAVGLPAEVYVLSSRDGGRTWGSTTRADAGTYSTQMNPREMPSVGRDGVLHVVYDVAGPESTVLPLPQARPIALHLASSDDGGRTFRRTVVDGDVHRVTSPDEALPYYTETITSIAASPVRRGELAIAWPEADSPASSHIVLRRSTDGGRTWGPRQRVGGAVVQDQQDHVALAYTPRGELVVVWRDRGTSGGSWDSPFQVWARMVGKRAVELTNGPQAPTTLRKAGPTMPSEFLGATTTDTHLLASWDQLVGSLPDNVFRAVPLSRLR